MGAGGGAESVASLGGDPKRFGPGSPLLSPTQSRNARPTSMAMPMIPITMPAPAMADPMATLSGAPPPSALAPIMAMPPATNAMTPQTTDTPAGISISQPVLPMSCSRLAVMQMFGQISSSAISWPRNGMRFRTRLATMMMTKPIQKSRRPMRPSAERNRVFQSIRDPQSSGRIWPNDGMSANRCGLATGRQSLARSW